MTKEMTRLRRKKSLSSRLPMLDLGTWGQFYTWPYPQNFKMPRLSKSGAEGRIDACCLHCGKPFKTNREEKTFCKPGCRTYNNRLKRAGIVRWLIDQGVPMFTALDTLEISGMAVVGRKMEALGLYWNGQSWEKKA